jgi:hypothetical protein
MADDPPVPVTTRDLRTLYNLYLLRVCDWISFQLCDHTLKGELRDLAYEPRWNGNGTIVCNWADEKTLCLSPWPLDVSRLPVTISALSIPCGKYRRESDLLRVFEQADQKTLSFSLSAPKIKRGS